MTCCRRGTLRYFGMLNFHAVPLTIPENANIVLGQSHFIKTVDDLFEAMVNSAPGIKFGVAFNEASGPCLTRGDGTDPEMRQAAVGMAQAVGAGGISSRSRCRDSVSRSTCSKACRRTYEVCTIFCATANPVQVIVAETEQGRGVMGVIDGSSPKGIRDGRRCGEAAWLPADDWVQTLARKTGDKKIAAVTQERYPPDFLPARINCSMLTRSVG